MRHPFTCRLSRCAISVVLWVFCSITSQKQRAAQKMDGQPENARFPLQKASGWFLPAFTGHNCAGGAAATPPRPYFPSGSLVLHATQRRTEGGRQKTRRRPMPGKPTAAHPLSKPRGKVLRGPGRAKKMLKPQTLNTSATTVWALLSCSSCQRSDFRDASGRSNHIRACKTGQNCPKR